MIDILQKKEIHQSHLSKNRKVYILGIVLLWISAFFVGYDIVGGFAPNFNVDKFNVSFFKRCILAIPAIILIAKGSGLWFSNQDFWERFRIAVAGILFASIVTYFLLPLLALFFPITSIIFIILIIFYYYFDYFIFVFILLLLFF